MAENIWRTCLLPVTKAFRSCYDSWGEINLEDGILWEGKGVVELVTPFI
jgi:hypothetical protein